MIEHPDTRWHVPDSRGFRDLMGLAPAPVAVLTGRDRAGEPLGMTVSSFTSISLTPPLALVSVAATSPTWTRMAPQALFAINLLAADQDWLARHFASGHRRFEGVAHERGPEGVPTLTDAYAAAEFGVFARHAAGDHEVVLGELRHARVDRARSPLVHHRGTYATTVPLVAPSREAAA